MSIYYDFNTNWKLFLEAWNHVNVQDQLLDEMNIFLQSKPYNIINSFGRPISRKYNKGDSLWLFNENNFFSDLIQANTHKRIKDELMIVKYKRTMENLGHKFKNKDNLEYCFMNTCFDEVYKQCIPKPNSIESFVLLDTNLLFTYLKVALIMFSDSIVSIIENQIIIDHEIIFDLNAFYVDYITNTTI
jgi:hypothetical protein